MKSLPVQQNSGRPQQPVAQVKLVQVSFVQLCFVSGHAFRHAASAALLARLHSLLNNAGFVSGHRFSDAVTAAKSAAPSGAELPDQSSTAGNEHTKSPPHQS